MRARLNQNEINRISGLQNRLETLREAIEKNDVELEHGNGTASLQLSCAIASLECILQEYY